MPRYALKLEYDGTPFVGWQSQAVGLAVQQVIEAAALPLNGGEPVIATAAGRTDARVHAEAMVVDLSLSADLPPERLREAINARTVPHPVVALAAARVADDFSARFRCIGRAYRYRIMNRAGRPALEAGRLWHVKRRLDAAAMHEAAQGLLGHHDFSAFRAGSCQAKSPMRTLERLDVARFGEEVVFAVEARSFLHHQVRNLVGSLIEVGFGRRGVEWPRRLLEGRNRAKAGQTAPPEGLVFVAARYDPEPDWV